MEGVINIELADFEKLDIRVSKIEKVEDIEGADKLYKLSVNTGIDKRVICAGIKQHYSKEELIGKRIIVLINLQPRKIRGIESQGMLLAASDKDHSKISLVSPDKDIDVGSRIG